MISVGDRRTMMRTTTDPGLQGFTTKPTSDSLSSSGSLNLAVSFPSIVTLRFGTTWTVSTSFSSTSMLAPSDTRPALASILLRDSRTRTSTGSPTVGLSGISAITCACTCTTGGPGTGGGAAPAPPPLTRICTFRSKPRLLPPSPADLRRPIIGLSNSASPPRVMVGGAAAAVVNSHDRMASATSACQK
jgi:hypothetical protein